MTRWTRWIAGIALALAPLAWGSAIAAAPPPRGGTITLEPATADGEYDPSMPAFVEAVTQALTDRGFTILEDSGHTAYTAQLILGRSDVGTGMGKSSHRDPVAVAGAGVVVPMSTGASDVVALQRSTLELRLHKRGETGVVWDGTAVTVRPAGTKKGTDQAVAAALSSALLHDYPTQPTETIGVP